MEALRDSRKYRQEDWKRAAVWHLCCSSCEISMAVCCVYARKSWGALKAEVLCADDCEVGLKLRDPCWVELKSFVEKCVQEKVVGGMSMAVTVNGLLQQG